MPLQSDPKSMFLFGNRTPPASKMYVKLGIESLAADPESILSFGNVSPTPWLTLLLVLGKSLVKQNLC